MDETTPTTQDGVENVQPLPNDVTGATGTVVVKTLEEIKDGTVKDVGTTVRHHAHNILDELEQHLSQFDARVVAVYHGFLVRLRNAL